MAGPSRYAQMYAPLRVPNYRMFIAGQSISTIGTLVQMTAQSWVVFELTHSSAALGWVGLIGSLPMIVLGPFAGALADRVNRRLLLIGTQATLAVLAAVFAVLVQTGSLVVEHVYVLAFASGIVVALDLPALQAFAADLAGPSLIRQAVTLNAMAFQMARMIGPSVAGLAIGSYGNATAFWMNAMSFVAVILAIWRIRFTEGAVQAGLRDARATTDGTPARARFGGPLEAVRHVFDHPPMLDLYLFSMLFTFLVFSTLTVYPAFVADTLHGDATMLGFLMGASGAGSLTCTLLFLPILHSVRRTGLLIAGALGWFGVMLVTMTVAAPPLAAFVVGWGIPVDVADALPVVVACFGFLQGMAGPVVMTTSMGLLQQMAPPAMRARLIGLVTSISFGMQPFAGLLVGYAGELLGAGIALRINGILLMISAGAMVAFRASVRAPSPVPATVPSGPRAAVSTTPGPASTGGVGRDVRTVPSATA